MDIKESRKNYTRVTTILYPFSGLEKVDPSILEKAGKRGTKVHKICEGLMQGIGEHGVDEETFQYVESFKKWWNEKPKICEIEKRFWDDENKITGQVDIIFDSPEGLILADLKTSYKPSRTWPVQGSAYCYLAKKAGYEIKKIKFLHLQKNGTCPKIHEYEIDDSLFLSVLKTFNHFYKE